MPAVWQVCSILVAFLHIFLWSYSPSGFSILLQLLSVSFFLCEGNPIFNVRVHVMEAYNHRHDTDPKRKLFLFAPK